MNDPGLDEPIIDNAKTIEQSNIEEEEEEEEIEQAYLAPSRWWFASTGFPLIAGTFGPMASAFSICALVESWRVSIPPGGTEAHGDAIPDPKWLLAVNGISLVLALVANLALLLNMARRLSFSIAQPITILGWYLASVLLIALVAVTSARLRLPSPADHALTQAYYYAIIAAALYFIVATLMVVTVYGALKGHYSRGFKLTMSQRSLMLQTISFMVYLLGGAAVWARIESWKFLDAVFWADFTLLTIGIGDYAPTTHLGRGLLFPYAIGGIVVLGLVVGSIRSLVLERGKKKLGARMLEKHRQSVLKHMTTDGNKAMLTPLSKGQKLSTAGKTERERREEEFNIMRSIQDKSEQRRRWTSLYISASAWFFLWFVGAVVFWQAEKNQNWSYFQSLYFAYISLLTIGYGDLRLYSNSGKPFFVFWSLLAVPTLTILISNMGDTIIKGIRDLTLWIGELTVLPGEGSFVKQLKRGAVKATNGKVFSEGRLMEEPPGLLSEKSDQGPKKHNNGGAQVDRVADEYEKEELKEADKAGDQGDKIREDIHYYHYLLVKEIRSVMKHLNSSPPRKYTYAEWAWFLKLMGEDEGAGTFHRPPPVEVNQDIQTEPELGQGQTTDKDGEIRQWSWLGNRSPLMGDKEEAEWVLERLSVTLEKELKKQRDSQRRVSEKDVPVSRGSGESLDPHRNSNSGNENTYT
ncbi:MAG: Potassium channel [Pleopsidium flavum]|nr:MAG: Potassium channel [Pleopsidium flavum]